MTLSSFVEFDRDKVRYKGLCNTSTTIPANTAVAIQSLISTKSYLSSWHIILSSQLWGDKFSLSLIDKDNVLGLGANYVYTTLLTDWLVVYDTASQGLIQLHIPVLIHAGTYIQFTYTNTDIFSSATVTAHYGTYEDLT